MAQQRTNNMLRGDQNIWIDRLVLAVGFVLAVVFAFFPIYWMIVTSLTPTDQVFSFPPTLFPTEITFEWYRDFFARPELIKYLRNSFIVATTTAVSSLVVSTYAAYSFSKFRYTGRKALMFLVLSAQMFPQALLLITLYLMFDTLFLRKRSGFLFAPANRGDFYSPDVYDLRHWSIVLA